MTATAPKAPPRKRRSWRFWNNELHRDVGYVVVGLTLIYAISGIAVNHIEDWNPNYSIERTERVFEPFVPLDRDATIARLVDVLDLETPVDAFRRSPTDVELIYEGWSVRADVAVGSATVERPVPRPVLFQFNELHLNRVKGAWTWIADAYAVALCFMALSGTVVLRGRNGITGRGKWLVAAGILLPVVVWVVG